MVDFIGRGPEELFEALYPGVWEELTNISKKFWDKLYCKRMIIKRLENHYRDIIDEDLEECIKSMSMETEEEGRDVFEERSDEIELARNFVESVADKIEENDVSSKSSEFFREMSSIENDLNFLQTFISNIEHCKG